MWKYIGYLCLLALLWSSSPLPAQDEVSEEVVKLQQMLLDGFREKSLGNLDKAKEIYHTLLKEDPANDAAAYELARVFYALEDALAAERYGKLSVELDSENPWYRRFLADVYQDLGRYKEAAALYEALVGQFPYEERYYFTQAYMLLRAGEHEAALQVYDQLEKRVGLDQELAQRRHAIYMSMGEQRKAERELTRLIDAFPKDIASRHLLASFYKKTRQDGKAAETYEAILQLDPGDARAQIALRGGGEGQGELAELKEVFAQADVPIDLKLQKLVPVIRQVAETGDKTLGEQALALTTLLEASHPSEAKAYAASGDLYNFMDNPEAARDKYRQALAFNKSVFAVWEQLMLLERDMRDHAALLETAEEALDYFPNQPIVYYLHAHASHALGRYGDALDMYHQVKMMSARDDKATADVLTRMGQTYFAKGDLEKSDRAFQDALKLAPERAETLSQYAYALARSRRTLEQALEWAHKATVLNPEDGGHAMRLGYLHLQRGKYDDALEWLLIASEMGQDTDPALHDHLGDTYYELGHPSEAIREWEKAKMLGMAAEALDAKIAKARMN